VSPHKVDAVHLSARVCEAGAAACDLTLGMNVWSPFWQSSFLVGKWMWVASMAVWAGGGLLVWWRGRGGASEVGRAGPSPATHQCHNATRSTQIANHLFRQDFPLFGAVVERDAAVRVSPQEEAGVAAAALLQAADALQVAQVVLRNGPRPADDVDERRRRL